MIVHRLPADPRVLIFDIDNTLYSDAAYADAQTRLQVERLAAERGESVEETEADLDRVRADYADSHRGEKTSLANAFALMGLPIETSIRWRIELLKPEDFLKKDPELIKALKALSRRFRLAALTNNPVEVGRRTLASLGVEHFFGVVVGLDSCGLSKPSREPFEETLRRLGTTAGRCVSIGDRFDVDLRVPLEMGMGAIEVESVADVHALPETLEKNLPPRKNAFKRFFFLPLAFAGLAIASSILAAGKEAYSIPLIDRADEKLGARAVARSYLEAYPELITDMKRDAVSGDWTLTVRGSTFAYANGRWMPPGRAKDWAKYRTYVDAVYPRELVEPRLLPESVLMRLRETTVTQDDAPPTEGSFAFALYGGDDKASVYARQKRISFLGKPLTAHELCVPALLRVSERILEAAAASAEVKAFVDTIESAGAFNWREIRGQKELSRHSFGIAVDILPKGWEKKSVYWQWDAEKGFDWAVLPLAKRWSPPAEVVDIFESEGFVWGGKWLVYDTMHFEYRPEMFRLRDRLLPNFLSVLN